jgi:broad specificity phosphatase PhoE
VSDPSPRPTETRILLLRHAETSAPDCFHGAESDVGLGPAGHAQAAAAARLLAAERPAAVIASGLRRAIETATPIAAACGVGLEVVEALHERRMGALSGRPRAEGLDAYAAAKRRWMAGDLDATHEGAESYAQIRARVVPALRDLAARFAGRAVVVVAHGVVIRVLLTSLAEGLGPEDFDRLSIEYVAVNEVVAGPSGWRAVALAGGAVDPGS